MKSKNNILKLTLLLSLAVFGFTSQDSYAESLDEPVESQDAIEQEHDNSEDLENTEESIIENQTYQAQNTAENPGELTRDPKVESQIAELQLAVNDRVNVINSNAYYNYASQELKAEYEEAIKNAQAVLARKDSASYEELRNAMSRINTAKQNISNQVNSQVNKQRQKNKLNEAIKRNQTTLAAAKQLKSLTPNLAKKFERQLNGLMAQSEQLIVKAKAMLATL